MADTFLIRAQTSFTENRSQPFILYDALQQPHVPFITRWQGIYDLSTDPGQWKNLAAQFPEKMNELTALIHPRISPDFPASHAGK